jgi:hypothetical protein
MKRKEEMLREMKQTIKKKSVTDLQGPPSECTQMEKLWDLKKLAQQYTRDWGSCDNTWISYLEILEERDDNLKLAQMISG